MRKVALLFLVLILVNALAGFASALTVYKTELEYTHDMGYQNYVKLYTLNASNDIVPALYVGNESNLPSWLNATVFVPLDNLDTVNNTTTVYIDGVASTATVYFNDTTGYPKLVTGKVGNALEFDGNTGETVFASVALDSQVYSIYLHVKINGLTSNLQKIFTIVDSNGKWNRLELFQSGSLHLILFDDTSTLHDYTIKTIATFPWEADILIIIDTSTITVYINDEVYTFSKNYSLATWNGRISLGGASTGVSVTYGKIDEFRVYTRALTQDEYNLLRYINRYKFATLSAPAASFDGTNFLVNITATLPGDGGSYLLPAPIGAQSSYTSVGTIGNFTFLDVGTNATVNFVLPTTPGQAVPGLKYLAIQTDEEVYAYGDSVIIDLVNATKDPFFDNATVVNIVENGTITKIQFSSDILDTLKSTGGYITVNNGTGAFIIDEFKPLKAYVILPTEITSPFNLTFKTLDTVSYKWIKDMYVLDTLKGSESYSLLLTSAGSVYKLIVTEELGNDITDTLVSVGIGMLVGLLLLVAFVEQSPTKIDDKFAKILIGTIEMIAFLLIVGAILFLL